MYEREPGYDDVVGSSGVRAGRTTRRGEL
jgi:hypothetical protein